MAIIESETALAAWRAGEPPAAAAATLAPLVPRNDIAPFATALSLLARAAEGAGFRLAIPDTILLSDAGCGAPQPALAHRCAVTRPTPVCSTPTDWFFTSRRGHLSRYPAHRVTLDAFLAAATRRAPRVRAAGVHHTIRLALEERRVEDQEEAQQEHEGPMAAAGTSVDTGAFATSRATASADSPDPRPAAGDRGGLEFVPVAVARDAYTTRVLTLSALRVRSFRPPASPLRHS